MRKAEISRKTRETDIQIKLNIDGIRQCKICSDIGFLVHMLETFSRHGLFDIEARIKGDIHIDQHHTLEDTGFVLGEAFKEALGDKIGIKRAGFFAYPMDDSLATVAIDIGGRSYLRFEAKLKNKKIGELETNTLEDFFYGFASGLLANLHIKVEYGRSDHHKVEAIFKAFAKAVNMACEIGKQGSFPPTK